MCDSETDREADAGHAALMAELSSLRELLVERDKQLGERDERLGERDERLAALTELIRDLRDEIRLLKNLPRRPDLKPSGLAASARGGKETPASGSDRSKKGGKASRKGRGPRRRGPEVRRREEKVVLDTVPEGAERKGYQAHTVRDVVFYAEEVTWLREVWRFPDGSRHVAPLPPGVATGRGQYGPEVKALAIMLYYQCQSTVDRIVAFLNDMGLDISKRQVGRFLNEDTGVVVEEQQDVLRIGMETAAWINVDDTGARHRAANGYCTVIGSDLFTHFRSTGSKSRLDFLEHLCAGEESCTVNDAALDYMRRMKLSGKVISRLASHRQRRFADRSAWRAHLAALGIDRIKGFPDPVKIASEGALWGAISEAGRIAETVILSDDAGQFNVGDAHALCWVHAERLIRKKQASNEFRRARVDAALENVWGFYRDLSAYRQAPCSARREALSARFDEIFGRRTGYASLDKQLQRLKANKGELLRVLECPDTPLHTNGAERDIRAHVTRRKISFGTRSESGPAARDACLGALKTCSKLDVSFRDYLRSRLGVAGAPDVPRLADLITQRQRF